MYSSIIGVPKIFLNPWTDTLWLTTALGIEKGDDDLEVLSGYYNLTTSPNGHCLRAPRLALPWTRFRKEYRENPTYFYDWIIQQLFEFETKELIIVVGDDSASQYSDIVFVKPRDTPASMLDQDIFEEIGWDDDITWEMIEEADMIDVKDFHIRRAAKVKEYARKSKIILRTRASTLKMPRAR
jgi:hypothetical protein